MNVLAGVTVLLSLIGLITAGKGRGCRAFLSAGVAFLLFLLSACGGALAFLYLIWH